MKIKTIAIALCSIAFAGAAFAQHANFAHPKLLALTAKNPELAACVKSNAALDNEIDAAFAKAKAAGEISAGEATKYKTMEANIAKHRAALIRDGGFSVADCKLMTTDFNTEKAAVELMATNKTQLMACDKSNAGAHAANLATMAKARAAKKITPAEEAEFKKAETANGLHLTAMRKDGYSMADCQARTKDIGTEKALIEKISK